MAETQIKKCSKIKCCGKCNDAIKKYIERLPTDSNERVAIEEAIEKNDIQILDELEEFLVIRYAIPPYDLTKP